MKICFIYPDVEGVEQYGFRKFYHGIGSISSCLKAGGHDTSLIYLEDRLSKQDFFRQIEKMSPDLIAFSSTTNQFEFVQTYASYIKEIMPNVPIIVGGAHPTLSPETVIKDQNIDFVCVGEGEYPMVDLANAIDKNKSFKNEDCRKIENIWTKNNGEVVRNSLRPLVNNLDVLPFVDRELFNFEDMVSHTNGWVDIMASRGCPYNCSYCCNHVFKKTFAGLGRYVRCRSVPHVLEEIRKLVSDYDVKILNFQDDAFTLDHSWTLEFCDAYKKEFDIPFWINTRVDRTNEKIIKCLADAGCKGIRIGLESGNEEIRKQILKREMSNDDIRNFFSTTKKYGLETYTCNMIGIPGETSQKIDDTIQLNRDIEPNYLQFSVYHPYPMTELYDICTREGYYNGEDSLLTYYDKKSVLKLPTITQEELSCAYDRFYALKFGLALKYRHHNVYNIYNILRKLYRNDVVLVSHFNKIVAIKNHLQGKSVSSRYKGVKQL
jgi:anaerobic magnesium-protoporphyrin IX monomethyl ester cyclase